MASPFRTPDRRRLASPLATPSIESTGGGILIHSTKLKSDKGQSDVTIPQQVILDAATAQPQLGLPHGLPAHWPMIGPFLRQAVGLAARRGLARAVNETYRTVPVAPLLVPAVRVVGSAAAQAAGVLPCVPGPPC